MEIHHHPATLEALETHAARHFRDSPGVCGRPWKGWRSFKEEDAGADRVAEVQADLRVAQIGWALVEADACGTLLGLPEVEQLARDCGGLLEGMIRVLDRVYGHLEVWLPSVVFDAICTTLHDHFDSLDPSVPKRITFRRDTHPLRVLPREGGPGYDFAWDGNAALVLVTPSPSPLQMKVTGSARVCAHDDIYLTAFPEYVEAWARGTRYATVDAVLATDIKLAVPCAAFVLSLA